jgi:hypothetical protein
MSLSVTEDDGGLTDVPAPSVAEVGTWLWGVSPHMPVGALAQVVGEQGPGEARSAHLALAGLDRAQRRALHGESATVRRRAAMVAQRALLGHVLERGLRRRVGVNLTTAEERVYVHLAARDFRCGGLRVCEGCLLVFAAPRARLCGRCKKPMRLRHKPHRSVAVRDRGSVATTFVATVASGSGSCIHITASMPRGPDETIYTSQCMCGHMFTTTVAQQQFCESCGTEKARTALSHARQSSVARADDLR